jgi:hypothetical protein
MEMNRKEQVTAAKQRVGGLAKRARAAITRTKVAAAATLAGGGLVAIGAGEIYAPAGLITGGVLLGAFGLFGVDVDHGSMGSDA